MCKVPLSDKLRPNEERPEQLLLLGPYRDVSWLDQLKPCFAASMKSYPFFELDSSNPTQDFVQQLAQSGKRTLVVDLLAFIKADDTEQDPVTLAIQRTQKRLRLAQTLAPIKEQIQWLSWVPYHPEMEGSAEFMLAGSTSGSTKSIAQEWGIWGRTIFADPSTLPEHWLLDELSDNCAHPEINYRNGQRMAPSLDTSVEQVIGNGVRKESFAQALPEQPVLLISGGGMGITADIAAELCEQIGPYRALVLGRTTLPGPKNTIPLDQPAQARKQIRAQLGEDATARQIQEVLQKEQRRAELANQLTKLEAKGIEVLYIPTDIQEIDAVTNAVEEAVARWGTIDGVIHGAGIDRSRNIDQKTTEEVALVLGVKLRGLANLRTALRAQSIHFWMAFGSVSARFGNAGQFDYAAANDAMARWLINDPGFSNSLVLDYTAWEEVGMAATLASLMKERGVDMLHPTLATTATVKALREGQWGEWVLSGRLPTSFSEDQWLGLVQKHIPGEEIQYETTLETGKFQYLIDHQIQDAEVMPGVVSFLSQRRAARHVAWEGKLSKARDIRFEKAVKIWNNRPLQMQSNASYDRSQLAWVTSLQSQRTRKGLKEQLQHASAIFEAGPLPAIPSVGKELIEQPIVIERAPCEAKEIYQSFFHGPCWQVLETALLAETLAYGTSPVLEDPLGVGLDEAERWDAVGLELMFQTAGLWTQKIKQCSALPFGIEECVIYQSPIPGQQVEARIQPKDKHEDVYTFDGLLLDEQNEPLIWISGLQMRIFPLDL